MITSLKINQLYSEMYEPKLLPQDLLENLKLDNYISVNFLKEENGLTQATTRCYLSNGSIAEYLYTFSDLKLIRLEDITSENCTKIIYDRDTEISQLKNELLADLNFSNVS